MSRPNRPDPRDPVRMAVVVDGRPARTALPVTRRFTTPDQLAAEAGVSVGLIYRYFSSKEELFLTVCGAATEQKLTELAVALSEIAGLQQRIETAVSYFVASLVEAGWGALTVQAWAEADGNPRLREMLQRVTEQQRAFATMFIREAIAAGEAPADIDVPAFGLATSLLLSGTIARQAEYGERFVIARYECGVDIHLANPLWARTTWKVWMSSSTGLCESSSRSASPLVPMVE
jgi:AcrR family transcriptional regulator